MPRGGRLPGSGWGEPPPNFLRGFSRVGAPGGGGRSALLPPRQTGGAFLPSFGNRGPVNGCLRRVYPLFPFHSLKRPTNPFSSNQRCRVPYSRPHTKPPGYSPPRGGTLARGGGTDAPSSGGKSESTTVVREPTPGRGPRCPAVPPRGGLPGGGPPALRHPVGMSTRVTGYPAGRPGGPTEGVLGRPPGPTPPSP